MFAAARAPAARTLLASRPAAASGALHSYVTRSAPLSASDSGVPSKDELNPSSKESTRSATHNDIAHDDDAAYNPRKTNPAEEKETAGAEESRTGAANPLEFSPATPEVSHQKRDDRGVHSTKTREGPTSGGRKKA